MDSALCDCKEAEQTVHHILQDCPVWRKQIHQLWPQDEPTTNKLFGTAEDLLRTTQFLETCGLRVEARLIDRRRRRKIHIYTLACMHAYMPASIHLRRPPRERKVQSSNPASKSNHTSDLKNGTPVATLLDVWHYRVSAGTGRPGVSIL